MARGTRTVHPSKRNKGLSSTFQPPEEGQNAQQPKRCNKHADKDEDNSPKNVNNVHDTSSHKYIYLPTPTLGQDMSQGQFLSGV